MRVVAVDKEGRVKLPINSESSMNGVCWWVEQEETDTERLIAKITPKFGLSKCVETGGEAGGEGGAGLEVNSGAQSGTC